MGFRAVYEDANDFQKTSFWQKIMDVKNEYLLGALIFQKISKLGYSP
jgi:hypothetical protein